MVLLGRAQEQIGVMHKNGPTSIRMYNFMLPTLISHLTSTCSYYTVQQHTTGAHKTAGIYVA